MKYRINSISEFIRLKKEYTHIFTVLEPNKSDKMLFNIFKCSKRYLTTEPSNHFLNWIKEHTIDFKMFWYLSYNEMHFMFKSEEDKTLFLLTWR